MLKYFFFKTVKYKLLNKFTYQNLEKLPKFEKIVLSFECKTTEVKQLAINLFAIKLITNQKSTLTKTKYSNIFLKIKKGHPAGCKITLRKNNKIIFLTIFCINIIPKITSFEYIIKKNDTTNTFFYKVKDVFKLRQLEKNHHLFYNLPELDVTFKLNITNNNELTYFLNLLKFSF